MSTWNDKIPLSDIGWKTVSIKPKTSGTNLRGTPVVGDNVVGFIASNTTKNGLVNDNPQHIYSDDRYKWYPVYLPDVNNKFYAWVASEVVTMIIGNAVNTEIVVPIPEDDKELYYDLPFPEANNPTIRTTRPNLNVIADVIEGLSDFLRSVEGRE